MTDTDIPAAPLLYPGTWVASQPDKTAIVMAETGETVSFAALDATANRIARLLRSLGLAVGDHVAICMENRIEYPQVMWGAHYAGLYYTLMSTRLTVEELAYIITDSGSTVLIVSDAIAAKILDELQPRLGDVQVLVVGRPVAGVPDLFALASEQSGDPIPDAVEGADMLYSSGTTGFPKGVQAGTVGRPLGTTTTIAGLLALLMGATSDIVYLSPAPMYHAAPSRFVQGAISLGGTAVIVEHFDPEGTLRAIERYHVTHAQFVPTMFNRMLRLPDDVRARYDLSSLQAVVHAAAPCPQPAKRAMIEWWGPVVHEYYAGTEGSGITWATSEDWLAHPGTVGRALIGQVHILDEEGDELPVGEEGLIYFGGGSDFAYHNDPDKTAAAHSREGFSTLGDIGRLDGDGFLYLTDRKSNMIITGGVNVYPQETENTLATHPKVLDVAVIGVPNEDFGEEVKAIVSPAPGFEASPELERELIAYCREHLADVKCPRSIDFREDLPRQPNGKLLKRLLRDEYWAGRDSRLV